MFDGVLLKSSTALKVDNFGLGLSSAWLHFYSLFCFCSGATGKKLRQKTNYHLDRQKARLQQVLWAISFHFQEDAITFSLIYWQTFQIVCQ